MLPIVDISEQRGVQDEGRAATHEARHREAVKGCVDASQPGGAIDRVPSKSQTDTENNLPEFPIRRIPD
jgi:hypothetical protein